MAAGHVETGGVVIGEVYASGIDWAAAVGRRSDYGPVGMTITRASVDGDRLTASVRYDLDGRTWDQPFEARLLDEAALSETTGGRRSRLRPLAGTRGRRWFVARPRQDAGSISTTRADHGQ